MSEAAAINTADTAVIDTTAFLVPEQQEQEQEQSSQAGDITQETAPAESAAVDTTQKKKKKKKKKSKFIGVDQNDGKPVVTLIVDTNPFVKGLPLDHIATKFVTVPDVVRELRSRASKDRFEALELKFGVDILTPDAESMQAVCDFAKKTGDFSTLALADLRVIALAFMLEKKANGMRHLRLEPVGDQPNISDRKMLESAEIAGNNESGHDDEIVAGEQPVKLVESEIQQNMEQLNIDAATTADITETNGQTENAEIVESIDAIESTEQTETAGEGAVVVDAGSEVLQSVANDEFDVGSDEESDEDGFDDNFGVSDNNQGSNNGADTDDGWQVAGPKSKKRVEHVDEFFNGGWITPKNVKQHLASTAMGMKETHVEQPKRVIKVACVTSDFAMQNVMLKMGIHLVTPDGVSVSRLRTWVLRCHACFHLTGDMNKQFCTSCGHATLKRCSVTTGANGRLQVHLKSNYQYNLRGTIYSMPKARGGQHTQRDIITRSDDRAYVRAMTYKERMELKSNAGLGGSNSLTDPDFIPGLLLGNALVGHKGFGVHTDARGMPMVCRNRRNPNTVKRTGNRKNKRRDD
ncbi:20S-pre-rRNA D-site endonuclease nob1 [Kickxella alabastrina]|uniref:20S-pre-rRNA D-site endonuclease nob1 n=1 Tax=Kickxella alabastrina TaxID=61397 RepID=A0ACC1IDQ1_9FUNG|nr:20S-pre-rRNA D-site endonuclease nob1 [Kickxella alabastrina]